MIEVVNCYYIYTLSNDLIMNMNMNSKNQDHYGGDYNKRFNRATMVEIITKEISRATKVEIITKEISRATMVENITIDSTRATMEEI